MEEKNTCKKIEIEENSDTFIFDGLEEFDNIIHDEIKRLYLRTAHKAEHVLRFFPNIETLVIEDESFDSKRLREASRLIKNVKRVEIDNPYLTSINGVVYSKDMKQLCYCPAKYEGDLVIPEGVVKIDHYATSNRHYITSVKIPNSLLVIGIDAFYGCNNLKTVDFGSSVRIIKAGAFTKCIALKELRFPESLTCIERRAFKSCHSIENVYLNEGLTDIGDEAFFETKISEIQFPNSLLSIGRNIFSTIEKIYLKNKFSAALIFNCMAYNNYSNNTYDVVLDDKTIVLPVSVDLYSVNDLISKIQAFGITEDLISSAYKYAYSYNKKAKYKVAVKSYFITKSDQLAAFIRRNGNTIIRLFMDNEDLLIPLLSSGIEFTDNAIDNLIQKATASNKAVLAAYAMNLKSNNKSKNKFSI